MRHLSLTVGCLMLLESVIYCPTFSQFIQQGDKLVGSGSVGTSGQGRSVSLSADGNTALIGGPGDKSGLGASWVFTRLNGTWSQQGTKLALSESQPDWAGPISQGVSVSLSADGNTALVGGPGYGYGYGTAYVFTRMNGAWNHEAWLSSAPNAGDSKQGWAVSLSGDANTALLGAPYQTGGAGGAWVFTRVNGEWPPVGGGGKFNASGANEASPSGLGWSVGVSDDGNTAIFGGPSDNYGVGAAWVFVRSNGVWSQQGKKLVGAGVQGTPSQGHSVSISGDGNTALVGGPNDNGGMGATWVFTRTGGVWTQQGQKLSAGGGTCFFRFKSAQFSA